MNVKYQVFVSSTYEDLKQEREQVVRAILEMGNIPVGMEMFSAADKTQWQIIARTIDNCDYHVVIIAHRYGSVDRKISFTEKEYDYAVKVGVPALAFVIDNAAAWPTDRMELDEGKRIALRAFKNKAMKKMVNLWKSSEDLYAKVSIALMKEITANPRTGWVRASGAVNPEVTNELSRLSKENSELRSQLRAALAVESRTGQGDDWARFFDSLHDLLAAVKNENLAASQETDTRLKV